MKPEVRSILRSFRSQAGIDAQEHLLAIQKQVCAGLVLSSKAEGPIRVFSLQELSSSCGIFYGNRDHTFLEGMRGEGPNDY